MPVIDDEETLILEEESRSKMSKKAKDHEVIAKKISHKPIDYEKLNSLIDDFEKRFSPQQELSVEQAFWFHILNPSIESSYTPPVIVEIPSDLPKESLVNASLKKLKFHLTQCDSVVKKRTTPSLKKTRVRHKEQSDSLINKLNLKSMENEDLKAQIQDKVFVITSLKNDLQKLKGKEIVENVVHTPSAATTAPGMFKLDLEPLPPRLLQNREVHIDYLRNTQEQANILWEIVEQAKAKQPLDSELNFSCKYATRIQELLVYVQDTCPNAIIPSAKKDTVKPMNNVKKVRFVEPLTSSSNIKQVESSNTSDSNTPVLSSTGVKCSTSNCGSKPLGNKKNDRISQTPSRNKKNKVEAQPRKVNKVNRVVKPVCDVDVKHSLSNANSEILCAACNKSMFDGVHDKCLLDLVQNGNKRTKSAKKHKKQNIWKPTGHVFTEVGFKWKPTGRTFTIVGNSCPLTRFTSTNVVPPKQTTSHSDEIQKPEIKVYSRKPKNVRNIGSSKIAKIGESKNANHSEPNQIWGSTAIDIPSSSSLVMTGCPDCTLVLLDSGTTRLKGLWGYGDYQLGNIIISRVYYVEGLGQNLFSVGKFCDADLEVAFRKNTCFIRNLEARTPQQNGVVERRNRTLVEAARTILIFSKAPLFLWAEAINIACYIQNRSLIRLRYNKTPYELMHDKKPDLSFFHVFGSLCYPTNDHEDLGKFNAKANIGISVGYTPAKKAFRIYNRGTQIITETIHVTFNDLTAMASKQFSLGPGLHYMTPATSSTGLSSNPVSKPLP
ncbi:retrovirus-related pol polyprotein from transposon TNT 1-94 [Tanacetum coccineum]